MSKPDSRFRPPIQIPPELCRSICQQFGLDQVIIYGRKGLPGHDGEDDMECLAHAGSSPKNAHIARVMCAFLQERVFGWKVDNSGILAELANAPEVSPDGRTDGRKMIFLPKSGRVKK